MVVFGRFLLFLSFGFAERKKRDFSGFIRECEKICGFLQSGRVNSSWVLMVELVNERLKVS